MKVAALPSLSLGKRKTKNKNSATFAKDLRSTCVAFGHPIASERKSSQVRTCVDLQDLRFVWPGLYSGKTTNDNLR